MLKSELKLQDIEFIAGSTQTLEFNIYGRDGEPLDLIDASATWSLSEMESEVPMLEKSSPNGITFQKYGLINVELTPQDTVNFISGKYEHELTIVQQNGKVLKPCYGFIRIKSGKK